MKLLISLRRSNNFKKILRLGTIIFTLLYVFFIPSFSERTSSLRYLVYATMIILGVLVIIYNLIFMDFKIAIPMLIIVSFVLFALIGTTLYSHEYRKWFSLVLLSVSLFIFVYAFRIIKKRKLIIAILAISFFLFTAYFIWHYKSELIHFKKFVAGDFRLGDYFDNPNGVAAYSVTGFATSLYCVLFIKRKIRFFFILPILTNAIVGISTGSRSFILSCLLFLIVYLYFYFRKHKIIYLISLIVLAGIFIGIIQLPFMITVRERIVQAFLTIFGQAVKADTATIERTVWFDYGLFLGSKNGIFGYGADGFSIFSGVGTYTHSNISEVLCDFGFIGFALFYSPLIIMLFKTTFDKHIDKPIVVPFIVFYIFIGISNVFYYKKIYYMILALCFYIVYFEKPYKKMFFTNKKVNSIVFTCESLSSGGAERVISILANEFILNNIKTYIVGISDNNRDNVFYTLDDMIDYIPLCKNYKKKVHFFKKVILLRKELNIIKPDVVISFLPHINFYTTCALFGRKNICHIVSERNNPITNPHGFCRKIAKRISFDLANGCVFQSNGAKNAYPESIQDKSSIILNPINVAHFKRTGEKKSNIFISTGRLTLQKNHDLLIDAFNSFNAKHGNEYLLKIYGAGPLKNQLERKCTTGKVIICEPDNKWLEKEKDAKCFVLSSDYEGLPNVLIEALSIGMPCISSDCEIGGPRELHNYGFKFELFKTGNKDDLITSLNKIVNDTSIVYEDNVLLANSLRAKSIAEKWLSYIRSM